MLVYEVANFRKLFPFFFSLLKTSKPSAARGQWVLKPSQQTDGKQQRVPLLSAALERLARPGCSHAGEVYWEQKFASQFGSYWLYGKKTESWFLVTT